MSILRISPGVAIDYWTIDKITNNFRSKKLYINPEYQRESIWDEKRKSRLIDSIMRDYPIGVLIILDKNPKFEVIDGQQRIATMFQFVKADSKLHVSKPEPGETLEPFSDKTFNRLTRTERGSFKAKKIPIYLLNIDEDKMGEIFLRLQSGVNPNTAEQLNAISSQVKREIIKLVEKHSKGKKAYLKILILALIGLNTVFLHLR